MMEMAENGDLLDYINSRGLLPEPEARYVMRSVAAGVAHCHSQEVVHRDLKCENIMITRDMKVKIGGEYAYFTHSSSIYTVCGVAIYIIQSSEVVAKLILISFSADFGFSLPIGRGVVSTPCGSYSYAAPELLSGRSGHGYDGKKVDIWSM